MSSSLTRFLKKNKIKKENTTYAATKSLVDENGEPLKWEIRALSTKENNALREECTDDIPVTGKPNVFRQKVDTSKYLNKMLVASVVEPNLYDAQLQDSYGVKTPEELLEEMVDNPGEYNDFLVFVQKFNGFDEGMPDKVAEAKN